MSDGKLRPESMDLLTPDALDRLGRLDFIARGVVEGFVTGLHKSPYKGFSAEFAEHRQYVPGDNIRDLDWRVYARNDRYYVKQYIEETNLRATVLLDASASMRYTGDHAARLNGRRLSKFEYARHLAASLAYLMINQQDAVGLVTFDAAVRRYVPARSRPTHLRILLDEMYQTQASDVTRIAPVFHEIAERVHRRGLVIIISDLFDDPEELLNALHHFRYRKHEVVLIHVMAEEELTFPFTMWKTDAHRLRADVHTRAVRGRLVRLPRRPAEPGALAAHTDEVRDAVFQRPDADRPVRSANPHHPPPPESRLG